MKNKQFYHRLGFAASGMFAAFRRQRSFRTQILLGLAALAVTIVLRPGLMWAAAVVLSIALVLALELLDTALECAIDRLHPETAPEIKLAKDIAAGAVLIASIGAACVGLLMIASLYWR